MDHKTKKVFVEGARDLNSLWLETGKKRVGDRFFGLFTKKGLSIVLWVILILTSLADLGIFYLLNVYNK